MPPPRKGIPWHAPESKWAGRALFFATGAGACAVSFATVALVVDRPWVASVHAWGFALPCVLTVVAFVQRRKRGPRWRSMPFFAGAVLLPVACWGALAAMPWVGRKVRARPFDPIEWSDPATEDERQSMLDDLLERHLTLGRARSEVEGLLGRPWLDSGWSRRRGVRRCFYVFSDPPAFLGFPTGHRFLEIGYDRDERVASVSLD